MARAGVGAPKALGRARQGRRSTELKGRLAERGGLAGLKAERVGCPGTVAGAAPRDPGEARTTCLGGWCHCGDPSSRGSRPPSSLPRDPRDLPGFPFSHCSRLHSLELTRCGAGCLLASKEGLSSACRAGPGGPRSAVSSSLGPGSRLLWKEDGLGGGGSSGRHPDQVSLWSEAHGAEVWEGEQSQQPGGQLRGEPPEVCGSVTNRRGGARRREAGLYGRCCVGTAPGTSLEQASCPGEEGPSFPPPCAVDLAPPFWGSVPAPAGGAHPGASAERSSPGPLSLVVDCDRTCGHQETPTASPSLQPSPSPPF